MNSRISYLITALIISVSAHALHADEVVSLADIADETQVSQEKCPCCTTSCRCTENCKCRTTGCRGCCETYIQDRDVNKTGETTCLAQLCDCSSGCCSQEK